MSLPSMGSFGSSAPASFASVGSRSMFMAGVSTTVPPGILPGQQAMNGTRTPPSKVVPLPSRNDPFDPA